MTRTPPLSSALATLALLAASAAAGEPEFEIHPLALPAGSQPRRLLVADVTGDGLADLIAAPEPLAQVLVRVGTGALGFEAAVPTAVPANVRGWRAGDMDGDGALDLVLRPDLATSQLRVLLGDGAGGFLPAGTLTLGQPKLGDHELLDADEDGRLDVALLRLGQLSVALGDGAGGLAAPGASVPGPPDGSSGFGLHALALDGDGHTDLVAVSMYQHGGPAWAPYSGDGLGHFAQAPGAAHGSFDADFHGSATGDIDGDGWTDFVISFFDYVVLHDPGELQIVHGAGGELQGSYPQDHVALPDPLGPIRLGDLDGDGRADVVGPQAFGNNSVLRVLLGDATQDFVAGTSTTLAAPASDVALADVDGDGSTDIVVAQQTADALTVLRNTAAPSGWSDAAGALAGAGGTPHLAGAGFLTGGADVSLSLVAARPLAPVSLVAGLALLAAPFKGGLLMPSPDLLLAGLATDADGQLALQAPWPAGLPAGLQLWLQVWIVDAAGPKGFAASNALGAQAAP